MQVANRALGCRGMTSVHRSLCTIRAEDFRDRRDLYLKEIKKARESFRKELRSHKKSDEVASEAMKTDLEGNRARRMAERHAKSEKRFAEHIERIKQAKQKRAERKRFRYGVWQEREAERQKRTIALADKLSELSKTWVTHETLDAHVTAAVDELVMTRTGMGSMWNGSGS